ncbi:MAG TPA: ABC transporter substrate-binding protein [Longimicrobiaceae bacterium]|nr:ABC transporter substrate-binding protein [Longimicrobiaceae bacterium]
MRSIRCMLPLILLAAAGALAGCATDRPDPGGAEVVQIGFSGPLSGGAAFYGRNVLNGLTMAVDEINEAGGIAVGDRRVTFRLASLDDRYLPNETAINTRRLLQQSRTPVVFVPHVGGVLAVQGMNTREPRFLVGAYSSDPRVLEAGNPLTLMIPPRYDTYAEPFVRATMQRFGKRLGLLPTTTSYGRAWRDMVAAEWRRQGGQVLGDHSVDYNTTTDFSGAVTRALAERPDVLLVGGPSQPTALVVRAARQQGFRGGFIVMDQAKFEEMDDIVPPEQLEGAVGIYPLEAYTTPGATDFVERYRQKFGADQTPTSESALNYHAMHVVAQAMAAAGTATDPEAIRAHLAEGAARIPAERRPYPIEGVTEQGHMLGEVVAAMVRDGRYAEIAVPPVQPRPAANR